MIVLLNVILFMFSAFGQDPYMEGMDTISRKVALILNNAVKLLEIDQLPQQTKPNLVSNWTLDSVQQSAHTDLYDLKRKDLVKWGVRLNAYYQYNTGLLTDDIGDVTYRQRIQAELAWNLHETGLLTLKKEKEKLALEREVRMLGLEDNALNETYHIKISDIHTSFTNYIREYLLIREKLQHQLVPVYTDLFKLNYIPFEKYTDVITDYQHVKTQLDIYSSEAMAPDPYRAEVDYPVMEIVPDTFFAIAKKNDNGREAYERRIEMSKLEGKSFVQDIRVTPYLRYYRNFYDDGSARDVGAAGISVGIPINGRDHSKAIGLRQADLLTFEKDQSGVILDNALTDIVRTNRELVVQLKDNQNRVNRIRRLIEREYLRKEYDPYAFNAMLVVEGIDELTRLWVHIAEIKEQLAINLTKASFYASGASPASFCKSIQYIDEPLPGVQVTTAKSTYIWSQTINESVPDQLAAALIKKSMNKVYLSFSKNTDFRKLSRLIVLLKQKNIECHALIGNNDLISKNEGELSLYLDGTKQFDFDGIHLDVEPHTFSDFKEKRDFYLAGLSRCFRFSQKWAKLNDKQLSASVPHFYPVEFYKENRLYVDYFIFMLYRKADAKSLLERLSSTEYISCCPYNTGIAVRPEDFTENLDQVFEYISKEHIIKEFSIHTFEAYNK